MRAERLGERRQETSSVSKGVDAFGFVTTGDGPFATQPPKLLSALTGEGLIAKISFLPSPHKLRYTV